MIQLNNITKNKDGTVTMDCHVIDRIENQDFSLTFNPDTREILSDMEGIDEYYQVTQFCISITDLKLENHYPPKL